MLVLIGFFLFYQSMISVEYWRFIYHLAMFYPFTYFRLFDCRSWPKRNEDWLPAQLHKHIQVHLLLGIQLYSHTHTHTHMQSRATCHIIIILLWLWLLEWIFHTSLNWWFFHWSLSDSKSPKVSKTYPSIHTHFSRAVIWIVLILSLIRNLFCFFSRFLGSVSSVQYNIDISVNIIFYSFFSPLARSMYFCSFSPSFI